MLKKEIYFVILMFAYITLLVHAAVPHHYHEDTGICFASHCKDSKEAHRHEETDSQPHQHEGNPTPDRCSVDNVYLPADNNTKNACCSPIKCDCGKIIYTLINSSLNTLDFIDSTKLYIKPALYHLLYHTEFISQSLGLRAPPVC